MYKHHLALLLVFACTTASYGQDSTSMSQSSSAGVSNQASTPAAAGYGVRKAPFGSLTESAVYQYSSNPTGADHSLMGWSVVPEVKLVHNFGLQADFTSLYMQSVYPGQSQLIMAAGPRYNLAPRSRFSPFIYAEAGEARFEAQLKRNVDWEPVAKGGFGLQARLSNHFGVTLVPGEWLGVRYDYNGSWTQNFSARAGITFILGGGSSKS